MKKLVLLVIVLVSILSATISTNRDGLTITSVQGGPTVIVYCNGQVVVEHTSRIRNGEFSTVNEAAYLPVSNVEVINGKYVHYLSSDSYLVSQFIKLNTFTISFNGRYYEYSLAGFTATYNSIRF